MKNAPPARAKSTGNNTGDRRSAVSIPQGRVRRMTMAILFGLIGFGLNFLDIEFISGATFKISILAGLFFPLVIALAWGWRYGLLSALAGGSQTMWWLWSGDGWGILYSVPVFTLWIVWHGWWAERRSENHSWYVASFAVEIPFRILVELGFLVVFRWLVSLNPPPWNPAVAWDFVSFAWLQTVAVKHTVTAYVLLVAAYVTLTLGPVRRFFDLPSRPAQRDTTAIYLSAGLFGLFLWALNALVHYFGFPYEGQTFWGIAVHGASAHDVFMRSVYMAVAILAGIVLARFNRRRMELQERLDHQNRILAAIRNVNQLIVREKDPGRLLDETCRLLVETRGFYNVWIVLTEDGRPVEPFFHTGFNGGFAAMAERLLAGDPPACARAALASPDVCIQDDPPAQCSDCPLAPLYTGRAGLLVRLEHAGRVFGWISLSCPTKFARSAEEHGLLKEVAGDIAFALWSMETEKQRETIECKYAAVLATTTDAVMAVDLDGRITVFNPGAEKLFGCAADKVLGSPISRFCPEDLLEEQAGMLRRVRETGAVTGYETDRLAADGRRVPVEISLSLHTDENDRPQSFNAVLRDITERRQAEEALKESERHLRSTLDGLSAHITVVDDQGKILLVNQPYRDFAESNGVDPDIVSEGTSYLSVCDSASGEHSEEAQFFADGIRAVLSGKRRSFEQEYPCHSPDEKRWFVGRVTPFAGKGPQRVIVAHENITMRKQAEEALHKSEDKYRSLFNQSMQGIYVHDFEGRILDVNQEACAQSGYSREEWLGLTVFDGHPSKSKTNPPKTEILQTWHQFARDRRVVIEAEHQRKDGTVYPVEISTEAVRYGDDRAILAVVKDITERKMLEQEKRQLEKRIQQIQKMEAVGSLAAGIAHDFNNLLFPIIGMSELLMEDLPPGSPEHENAQEIMNAGKRGGDLVKQILAFSRQTEHQMIPVRVQQVLKEVLKLCRSSIPAEIEITQNLQPDCGLVLADPTQVHQVAMNLITNAYHACEAASGTIHVSVRQVDIGSDDLKDKSLEPGPHVLLTVEDTACGIDPELLDKIFEPYFTTKEVGKGTGLGLATVYGIVKEHRGDIKVDSEPGRGAVFTVYLPLMEPSADADTPAVPSGPVIGGSERILIVDDDDIVGRLEQQILDRLGYRTTVRTSSIEALEAIKAAPQSFDLVITDMSMPQLTGDRLAREILVVRPDIPVVICTGFSERINHKKAKSMGLAGFLMKPVIGSELARIVRQVLDDARSKSRQGEQQ